MSKRAVAYMSAVILLGVTVFGVILFRDVSPLRMAIEKDWLMLLSMIVLSAVARSFPVYMKNDEQAIDMSVICITAVYLCSGMEVAMIVYVISSFFTFEKCPDGTTRSFYNTDLKKTLFNVSAILLSIFIPAMICRWTGIRAAQVSIPDCLPDLILFSLLTYIVNAGIMMTLFHLMGAVSGREAIQQVIGLLPNVMATMPIGLLIALLYQKTDGPWIVFLMLLPLLLARYAWKLYLNAQKQQRLLIQAFISTMEAKDKYTEGHSRRVSEYAMMIGTEMGLKSKQLDHLGMGALIHDIGKIGICDAILSKPSPLNDEEWAVMRSHSEIGVHMVEGLGFAPEVTEIIGHHHQWYNGGGYPAAKPGEKRSVLIDIMGVADAFDAMTSDRAYRAHMSNEKAIAILRENSGTQFAPEAVEALVRALDKQAQA